MVARIKANIDAAEAERTSERVARKHLENARTGKPVGGTRPFGWEADKATIRPAEAKLIRAAAEDLIAGVGVRVIVRDWNDRGVLTPSGRTWSHQTVRKVLRSPRLAGWRIHQEKVALDTAGQSVRGLWEPILDDATHKAVVAVLSRPEGRTRIPRRGSRRYLLSGLVRCGVCNALMYGNAATKAGTFAYACHPISGRHVNTASGPRVDEVVTTMLLEYLAAAGPVQQSPVRFEGEARLAEVDESIRQLMTAFQAGKLSAAVVFPAVQALEQERDDLRAERDAVEVAGARPAVSQVDRATWDKWDTDRRRALAETVFDAVMVRPVTRRQGHKFDETRVAPVWKGAS